MIARFWYDGAAHDALRLAQIGCLPDPYLDIETTDDAGATWRRRRLETYVNEHPEIITATHRSNRRRGRLIEWIITVPVPTRQAQPAPERTDPMNIDVLYPERYLKPEDLRGQTVTVTVAKVTIEELRNPRTNEKTRKAVLSFAGKQKVLPLNKTQAYAMVEICTSRDTDGWPGHKIALSAGRAPNGQQTIVITAPHEPEQKVAATASAGDADAELESLPRAAEDAQHMAQIN